MYFNFIPMIYGSNVSQSYRAHNENMTKDSMFHGSLVC